MTPVDAHLRQGAQQDNHNPSATGVKFDGDKTRFDLLDPLWEEGVAKVLTFGAHKYAAENWRNGISYKRLIGALRRHVNAIQKGEDVDPETGLLHAYHAGCCLMFLSNFQANKRHDLDDRVHVKGKRKHTLDQSRQ